MSTVVSILSIDVDSGGEEEDILSLYEHTMLRLYLWTTRKS